MKSRKTEIKAVQQAEELGSSATEEDKKNVEEKLPFMKRGVMKKIWDKVEFLWNAYKKAEIPVSLQVTVIGALLYLILPVDVVPDYIPGIGLIDDFTVVMLVFKEVSKYVVPKAVEHIKRKVFKSIYKDVDKKLDQMFTRTLVRYSITFGVNCIAFALLVYKPFEETASRITAYSIFAALLVYNIANWINNIQKYGEAGKGIAKSIWKEKNIKKGITDFVMQKYPVISKVYAGIDIAAEFVPGLDTIPDCEEIIDEFVKHYRKRIILFIVFAALYSLVIFIIKYFLV